MTTTQALQVAKDNAETAREAIRQRDALRAENQRLREALRGFVFADDNRAVMPADIDSVNLANARAALKGAE